MPNVIALMGLPGSGKTTIAMSLVSIESRLRIISRDTIRDAMFRPCDFTDEEKSAAYQALLLAARASLHLKRSIIIDGMTFSRSSEVKDVRDLSHALSAKLLLVYVQISEDIAEQRIARDLERGVSHTARDRSPGLVRDVAARSSPPPADALILDGANKPVISAKRIQDALV